MNKETRGECLPESGWMDNVQPGPLYYYSAFLYWDLVLNYMKAKWNQPRHHFTPVSVLKHKYKSLKGGMMSLDLR